jgi:hypothetical protein
MAMRIDQPREHSSAARVDAPLCGWSGIASAKHPQHLAIISDHQTGEALQLAIGADLNAIRIVDQRLRVSGRREKGRERKEVTMVHPASLAVFVPAVSHAGVARLTNGGGLPGQLTLARNTAKVDAPFCG